jgi:hypothetical protein
MWQPCPAGRQQAVGQAPDAKAGRTQTATRSSATVSRRTIISGLDFDVQSAVSAQAAASRLCTVPRKKTHGHET